jgi:Mg2+ and Co2+ transporter CorA
MTDGFASIIEQLERQKAAIERALAALREVDGTVAAAATAAPASSEPATRNANSGKRNRRSEGQRKRWAAKKAGEPAPSAIATARKIRLTPEGRERLAEAMKRRWAVKRAASAVKKTVRKQRAAKKVA